MENKLWAMVLLASMAQVSVAAEPAAPFEQAEARTPERFEAYSDVMKRLVNETVACTPENWTHGMLTITTDGSYIEYALKNADEPGKAKISEDLRTLIDELYIRMRDHGDSWSEAVISFQLEGDSVNFKTSFKYDDKQ